jgi:hypothetical protein
MSDPLSPQNAVFYNEPPSSHASERVTVSAFHGAGSDAEERQLCELMNITCDHRLKHKVVSTAPPPQHDPLSSESTQVIKNRSEADITSSTQFTSQSVNRSLNSSFQGARDFNIDNSQFFNVGKQKNIYNYGGTYGASISLLSQIMW